MEEVKLRKRQGGEIEESFTVFPQERMTIQEIKNFLGYRPGMWHHVKNNHLKQTYKVILYPKEKGTLPCIFVNEDDFEVDLRDYGVFECLLSQIIDRKT